MRPRKSTGHFLRFLHDFITAHVIEYISSGPLAGEFDVLSDWLIIVIVEPLSNFLDEISSGNASDIINMNTYPAGFDLIEWHCWRSERTQLPHGRCNDRASDDFITTLELFNKFL